MILYILIFMFFAGTAEENTAFTLTVTATNIKSS
jgi:hypothetical protein